MKESLRYTTKFPTELAKQKAKKRVKIKKKNQKSCRARKKPPSREALPSIFKIHQVSHLIASSASPPPSSALPPSSSASPSPSPPHGPNYPSRETAHVYEEFYSNCPTPSISVPRCARRGRRRIDWSSSWVRDRASCIRDGYMLV